MKAILIDDHLHSLYLLEKQLSAISDMEIIGKYDDPQLGKAVALKDQIDVVFLETVLENANGIVLAKQIKKRCPHIHIVFVTAHREYALDAYNLNALDYIIKPIRKDRLSKTIDRIHLRSLRYGS